MLTIPIAIGRTTDPFPQKSPEGAFFRTAKIAPSPVSAKSFSIIYLLKISPSRPKPLYSFNP